MWCPSGRYEISNVLNGVDSSTGLWKKRRVSKEWMEHSMFVNVSCKMSDKIRKGAACWKKRREREGKVKAKKWKQV
jgi:hypothetical protein